MDPLSEGDGGRVDGGERMHELPAETLRVPLFARRGSESPFPSLGIVIAHLLRFPEE